MRYGIGEDQPGLRTPIAFIWNQQGLDITWQNGILTDEWTQFAQYGNLLDDEGNSTSGIINLCVEFYSSRDSRN